MKIHAWAFVPLLALAGAGCADGAALSPAEIDDLRFTREEEKLAHDVYVALDGVGQPFLNVQQSEQSHMDAVASLIADYALTDPVGDNGPGVFDNADLKALYPALVEQGSRSVDDAFAVGCAIEELDLRDVEAAKARAMQPDVVAVYDNLLRGSRNHLRAFYGALSAGGGSYAPQFIDQAAFEQIVTSANESGRNW